jgi:hypothetical protein
MLDVSNSVTNVIYNDIYLCLVMFVEIKFELGAFPVQIVPHPWIADQLFFLWVAGRDKFFVGAK